MLGSKCLDGLGFLGFELKDLEQSGFIRNQLRSMMTPSMNAATAAAVRQAKGRTWR